MNDALSTSASNPAIDELLSQFFAVQQSGKKGVARQRIEEVERQLRACVEAEAERILVTSDLLLLASEREFDPAGAVARVMHADDLVFILSIFVEPGWQPSDPAQRQAQLRMTRLLTSYLLDHGFVSRKELCCPLLDIRAGISRGQAELRQECVSAKASSVLRSS